MNRAQLEHAIRAACDILGEDEIYVFGSQAILASFPELGDSLRMSMEADVSDTDPPSDRAEIVSGAIGEGSHFHDTHGFWVHGFPITNLDLPSGWKQRVVRVRNSNTNHKTGLCLDPHDIAASKLSAGRPKDRRFVRRLLLMEKLDPDTLVERLGAMTLDARDESRLADWVWSTSEAISR